MEKRVFALSLEARKFFFFFSCASLPLCGGAVFFVGYLPRSELRFPLATGSPYGTSRRLLEFGSLVLSLHVFFVSLCG